MTGGRPGQLSLFGDGELAARRLAVTYSNRMETLLRRLAGNIRSFRRDRDLFATVTVLIPESSFEPYLQFRLSEILGIAANIEFRFLDSFLDGLVATETIRPLRRPLLEGLLLRLFLDEDSLRDEELSPLAAYMQTGTASQNTSERRAVQLAQRLARLFTEYGVSRPEMLERWAHPRTVPKSSTEAWQIALYRRIFLPGGLLDEASAALGVTLVPMPRGLAFQNVRDGLLDSLPEEIHLFGFSYMARAYQDVLARLSREMGIHVYALNPCREFWEDVPDRRPARKLARARLGGIDLLSESQAEDPFDLGAPHESVALVLWGRPGREHIRMLNELTDCDFEPLWDESEPATPTTLLSHLQREILERKSLPYRPEEPEESLTVLACPGPRREAESIALEIVRLLRREEDPVKLNEIAVLLPAASLGEYLPHLAAAFAEYHSIPFSVTGLDFVATGSMAEAAVRLLALPGSTYRRQDVISAVTHPAVLGRFPALSATQVAAWCESLGILYGASREDLEGTYVEKDLFSWDQGIRRLVLGAFTDPVPNPASEGILAADGHRLLPFPLPSGDVEEAGELGLFLRSLLNDAMLLSSLSLELGEWADHLSQYLVTYLVPRDDFDEQELLGVLRAVRLIEESALPGLVTSFETARDLARGALGTASSGRGQLLARGVTVGPLMSLRALPFKAIFVAGLSGGSFPASDLRDALDLRGRKREPGDVTPRERDLYLFLEALLSARERLVLSYVRHDPRSKDPIEPSSVVQELRFLIEQKRPGLYEERILRRVPEERTDEEVEFLPLSVQRERAAARAGKSIRARLGIAGPLPEEILGALERSAQEKLAPVLSGPLPAGELGEKGEAGRKRLALSLRALQSFLECPIQAVAEAIAGLTRNEDSETEALRSEEAFDTGTLERTLLLRQTFVDTVRNLDPGMEISSALAETYDRLAWRLEAAGLVPTGSLGAAEREAHLGIVQKWVEAVEKAGIGFPPSLEAVAFGRASEEARVDRPLATLALANVPLPDGSSVDVELYGTMKSLLVEPRGSLVLSVVAKESFRRKERKYKDLLRAFVEYAVLVAAGQAGEFRFRVVRAAAASKESEGSIEVFELEPWRPAEAKAYLSSLAAEMLAGKDNDLFPYEAVMPELLGTGSFEDAVEAVLDNSRGASFTIGPIPDAGARPVPPPEEVARRIKVRFEPFRRIVVPPPGGWK